MIQIYEQLAANLLKENEPSLVLVKFAGSYLTPEFMRHVEKTRVRIAQLLKKTAFVGMTEVQKTILKGFNYNTNSNRLAFETEDAAIAYLLTD